MTAICLSGSKRLLLLYLLHLDRWHCRQTSVPQDSSPSSPINKYYVRNKPPKNQEWQRRWIVQSREQGGKWSAEDYEPFQRRYFAEDRSGGDFVKDLEEGLEELVSADPIKYFQVKLSDKEAKKTALQRAVSGMLKADWVVLRDL